MLLEVLLLVIGLLARLLGWLFPEQQLYVREFEKADLSVALLLLYMFGAYTVLRVAIRLFRGIEEELKAPRKGDVRDE
ncbi:MAG: hypothetical protein A3G20_02065 [Acidobacteria bacterium RIFCSPLOWO2_12_FULL_59_11]|nr:MAG: hypothetical protein A3G20_02065 [Acidobacteria bacterium RIFCSPLOWO2_12_FULL_59_11]